MCQLHQRAAVLSAAVLFLRWTFISSSEIIGLKSSIVKYQPCNRILLLDIDYKNAEFNETSVFQFVIACWYVHDNRTMTDINGKEDPILCPINFKPVHLKGQTICYKLKNPEMFEDFYKDCAKNFFSLELYNQLDINKSIAVWTEFKTAYPGGPLHDQLHHELDSKYKVIYPEPSLRQSVDLCILIDPVKSYVAVRCDKKHYRYCFVEPMAVNNDDILEDRCRDLKGSLRFSSPVPACLTLVNLGRKGSVMYETKKTEEICKEKNSTVLNKGWIYINHQRFEREKYLLKVTYAQPQGLEVPAKDTQYSYTYLINRIVNNETSIVQLDHLVPNVICERIIELEHSQHPKSVRNGVPMESAENCTDARTDTTPRPEKYCNENSTDDGERVPPMPLGEFITIGCETYRCVEDLNEGALWYKSIKVDCNKRTRDQIIADLQHIVNEPVPGANITRIFHEVNDILQEKQIFKDDGIVMSLLEQLGATVELNESQRMVKFVETNVALLVADNNLDSQIWGFKMRTQNNSQFTNDSFEFITELLDQITYNTSINDVAVVLPISVKKSMTRIIFTVVCADDFSNSPFGNPHFGIVNSCITSVTVKNLTQFQLGEVINIYLSPMRTNILRNESRACAYWKLTGDVDKKGYWSQDGCTFIGATQPGMMDTCHCNHLTHFALVIVPRAVFSENNELALEIISIIGCCLSILGLIMVFVTATTFRTWRKEFSNKIYLQLCISILFRSICFLIIALAKFDHHNSACKLFGIALHYSVLCSFCWMLVAAVLAYRKLVLVFTRDPGHRLLRACAFSYGAPCVGILPCIVIDAYDVGDETMGPQGSFCYPSGLSLWMSVYAPLAALLIVNWILFAFIVRSVFMSKRIQRYGNPMNTLKSVCVNCFLVVLFGLPWISGIFTRNLVGAYIFTVSSTFEGFVLCILLVLGNVAVLNMWLKWVKSFR